MLFIYEMMNLVQWQVHLDGQTQCTYWTVLKHCYYYFTRFSKWPTQITDLKNSASHNNPKLFACGHYPGNLEKIHPNRDNRCGINFLSRYCPIYSGSLSNIEVLNILQNIYNLLTKFNCLTSFCLSYFNCFDIDSFIKWFFIHTFTKNIWSLYVIRYNHNNNHVIIAIIMIIF